MLKGKKVQTSLGFALIALLMAGTPAHAKFWRIFGGVLATVGGVGLSIAQPELAPVGVALVNLQGKLLSASAIRASDPELAAETDFKPSYAGGSAPEFCEDGRLSCPAVDALLRMDETKLIEVNEGMSAEVADFVKATNRVIEDGNLLARHAREDAPLETKKQDLQLMAKSLEAAATAFDQLELPLDLSQSDIYGFQKETAESGLPEIEQSFWLSSGLTPEEVDAVAKFLASTSLELGVESVSMSRVLHEEAAALASAGK